MGAYGCIVRNVTSNSTRARAPECESQICIIVVHMLCFKIEIGELTTWHAMAVLLLCFKIEIGHLASPLQGCRASLLLPVLMLITMFIMMLVIIIGLINDHGHHDDLQTDDPVLDIDKDDNNYTDYDNKVSP